MATATAFGSITIIDVTDIGEFSVYPMSNLPLSVIYDPNQGSFTPNWGNNNLTLTPVVYYAGKQITLGTSGLTVEWQRQEGIGSVSNLTTGETNSNGTLTVSANKFTSNSSMLTYLVTASYVEPSSGYTLSAQGQITFSLTKLASNIKDCRVTGDNVFKYDTNGVLVGSSFLTISGTVENTTISKWQYKNSSGVWTDYPLTSGQNTSISDSTLNVYASENTIFNNDRAVIRLLTADSDVYDVITITKLRDGAPGANNITAVLSNESQMIPCDSNGSPVSGAFDQASTTITIYDGGEAQSGWTITPTPVNVTGNWDASTRTYRVNTISAETGSVTFECTKTGFSKITKKFALSKIQTGQDGVSPTFYSVDASTLVVNRSEDLSLNPSSITFYGYQQKEITKTAYAGRFKIYIDGSSTPTYTSTSNESSYTLNLTNYKNANTILCELYNSGGSTLYDSQSVVIVDDGKKGDPGEKGDIGKSAINVILGNQADVIPVTTGYKVATQTTINIPFAAYEGTNKIACSASAPALFGQTASITNATTSSDGRITYTIPTTTTVGSSSNKTGTVAITFTYTAKDGTTGTVTQNYTWTISVAATSGTNAVLFQLMTPSGYVFVNGDGNLSIKGMMYNGSSDATSSVTAWEWAKYNVSSSSYVTITSSNANGITGYTTETLTVPGSSVDGFASYRCIATYGGKTYTQYASLIDKTDPVQLTVFSSVGTQIVNGQGIGAIYAKVTQNNVEIDALKSEVFSTTNPTNAKNGDYYYKLDSVNKTVTLMKYTTSWAVAPSTDRPTGTYTWSYRDSSGQPLNTGIPATSGKVVYIDASLINKKLIIDCEVDI